MRTFFVVTNIFPGHKLMTLHVHRCQFYSFWYRSSVMVLCFTPLQAKGNVSLWLLWWKCVRLCLQPPRMPPPGPRGPPPHIDHRGPPPRGHEWDPRMSGGQYPSLSCFFFFSHPFVVKSKQIWKQHFSFIWCHYHFIVTLLKFKPTEG